MTNDPAVEAAIRAWIKPRGSWARKHFDPTNGSAKALTDSAREALKPVQGWFDRWDESREVPPEAWSELAKLIGAERKTSHLGNL